MRACLPSSLCNNYTTNDHDNTGTGHHYFMNVFDDVCEAAEVPCARACPVAKALYPVLATPRTKKDYETGRRELRRELVTLEIRANPCEPLTFPSSFRRRGPAAFLQEAASASLARATREFGLGETSLVLVI